MKKGTILLITDNGYMIFEGTQDQFRDCFFSNASEWNIRDWCEKHNFDLEIKEGKQ